MTLSTGKTITASKLDNGASQIDQELTEQEWQEYCRLKKVVLVAERLRGNRWAVTPDGQCGTCGYWPYVWTIEYVTARSEREALKKATYAQAQFKQWQATLV